jgi:hypothetical protein
MVMLFEIVSDTELLPKGRFGNFEEALMQLVKFGKRGDTIKGKWQIATKTSKGVVFVESMKDAVKRASQ